MGEPFYVTTPIYYVNDVPHIGHAYTTLACDVLARFMRLDGRDVYFLTGTDEHGQKVEEAAAAAGIAPKDFVDGNSARFRELAQAMNISNDDFIRTTEQRHYDSVQHLWQRLRERDEIYLGSYAGWYSVRDEAYYTETELQKGPDGEKIAPTGAPVTWMEEPSYFFKLSAWQDRLLAFYDENPDFIGPKSRRNEVISFVSGGLNDLSVSRTSFKWGVPVPDDPDHVMYVWLDALTNYMTGVGYPDTNSDLYSRFWASSLHMVGKDILRFHAVYWPAFLMAAEVTPPRRVFAHGWWTNEGQKISKSTGNVIDPHSLIDTYGLDAVRYFLLREVPFGNDGDFSHTAMINRMNGELANDYGNLAQRVLSMVHKNCEGVVPEPGELTEADREFLDDGVIKLIDGMRKDMERQAFNEILENIWVCIRAANAYVDTQAPWKLRKEDPPRMNTVLYVLAEAIRHLALATLPFMPESSDKLLDQLCIAKDARDFNHWGRDHALAPGTTLPKPEGVFPRFIAPEEDS
ncbi:MAG: methionine--tRNA ligase [Rhodospirillales bacterium]|jgi:methionyl-tRNA synthetase|nr:methionine--tRNA ligase [Rhodospirillales bacterium]MBT4006050.1 methionine--tRNA ligase [Rhodospirillales bacterium]MBT5077243.1 methionine--tRNA ligase [Rhodospirillales bacterium]MBT5112793.1 methionine--tRNA ligase [Rhodospirillales bacterium]MBT5673563.1 methionine--tRNA ligase [Rhodospirillales bacterium]